MRASLLVLPLLISCGGGSATKPATETKPVANADGDGTKGFDEYPNEYGADEYGEFGYDDGYYGGYGYGGDEYGYGGYDDGPYVPPPPTPPNLVGTWHGPCAPSAKESFKQTLVVTATRWDLTEESFADTTCTKRASLALSGGPYTFGEQSTTVTTAWNAVFSFDKRELTADNAKTAKALGKLCGVKKMKAGTAVSILDKGCAKLGFKPLAACGGDFDLVTIEGLQLKLGARPADNDLCTEAKRPTSLMTAGYDYEWPKTGVAECDQYFADMASFMKCPAIAPYMTGDVLTSLRESATYFTDATSCKAASDGMAQARASYGC